MFLENVLKQSIYWDKDKWYLQSGSWSRFDYIYTLEQGRNIKVSIWFVHLLTL